MVVIQLFGQQKQKRKYVVQSIEGQSFNCLGSKNVKGKCIVQSIERQSFNSLNSENK